jgi:hypothetical protein
MVPKTSYEKGREEQQLRSLKRQLPKRFGSRRWIAKSNGFLFPQEIF